MIQPRQKLELCFGEAQGHLYPTASRPPSRGIWWHLVALCVSIYSYSRTEGIQYEINEWCWLAY